MDLISGCDMMDMFDIFIAADASGPDNAVFAGIKIDEECVEQHEFPACLFLCIANIHGRMKYTEDGGETLVEATVNAPTFLNMVMRIQMIDENVGYAAGAPNVLWKTVDGGKTWEDGNAPGNLMTFYNDLDFVNEDVGFLAAGIPEEEKGLAPSSPNNPEEMVAWLLHRQRMIGDPLYRWQVQEDSLRGEDDPKMSSGKVYRTRDGGETWDLVLDTMHDGFVDITMVDENIGWIIGEPHAQVAGKLSSLYYTNDGGDTWEDVSDRLPISVEAGSRFKIYRSMFSGNGQIGFLAGAAMRGLTAAYGLLLYTEDGGLTWTEDTSYTDEIVSVLMDFKWVNNHVLYGAGMDKAVGKYTQPNTGPTANAGVDQTVALDDAVQLDGSASVDPDGDPLTYLWEQTGGAPVELTGADTATPTFDAGGLGDLEFTLTVGDGSEEDADTVVVSVTEDGADDDADDDDGDDDDDDEDDDDDDDDDGCGC